MKYLPIDTLAQFDALAQRRHLDFSARPLRVLANATKEYKATADEVSPDIRALEFYACNHIFSKIAARFTKNERLPDWALELASAYRKVLVEQGTRLMHYIVCITTREARHLDSSELSKIGPALEAIGGPNGIEFVKTITAGMSEYGAIDQMLSDPPDMTCGAYFKMLEALFNKGWAGKTSYGGKNWGNITRPMVDFLHGKISLEMLTDTAYTLAHNNGPMFNKGMMYTMYTKPGFMTILDVQRSGQIIELVKTRQQYPFMGFKLDPLAKVVDEAYSRLPGEFGAYVDWQKVEDLGSLSKYPQFKAKQPAKPVEPVVEYYMGKKAEKIGKFTVTDGEEVAVFSRSVA